MTDAAPARDWRADLDLPRPRSIIELIRAGTLDAELAATLWILIEGRVPVIVAATERGAGTSTLLAALLDFLPPNMRVLPIDRAGSAFDQLPQASELGWRSEGPTVSRPTGPPIRSVDTVLHIPELSDREPDGVWGDSARIAVRAASVGYGIAATTRADALDELFTRFSRPPVALSDDELSRLGIVLVLRRFDDDRRRVTAAHYLRPTARDEHGHVQRLGPAVLAIWDPASDRFEGFGWGITPELALRVGRRAGDFELEVDRRRAFLAGLVEAGTIDTADVRSAIDGFQITVPT